MFVNSSQQLAEKKLLLLYIFKQFDGTVSHSQVTDFVLENDLLNYFIFQQFIGELKDSKFIVEEIKDQKQLFTVTDKGKDTLRYFINRIPQRQLDRVNELLKEKKHEIVKKSQVTADYVKVKEGEYLVNLKVVEGDVTIISISLNVASNKHAKQVCENWQGNVQDIYGTLINQLIETPKEENQK
ncbi:DUF4364 family protein [Alkaliphilus hydrothermalis]|uniref:Transcriptional regulator n=1 Tax=Alkaliphilus hydrothermalis TaxID=1482730 RepID=A0ABS2NTN6_9FIRM|nr:DUF4364 family protein [Alkaliphilus hydrothermalis]MBM7616325.1 putative transcriptional regulator [Alkaliphilus hydrothermalis]